MEGSIFLMNDAGKLIELKSDSYNSERVLQGLLANYPKLLAGEQINNASPRRWLLISREVPIPDEEEGKSRWAIDHLFIDQDSVPTLIEVKRSKDSRIRRKVVGQMLDYAANAVLYWSVDTIKELFESHCRNQDLEPSDVLHDFLEETDPEEFWKMTKTNLQAGRIRLVFVADEIPRELSRIVEFLNNQMDPAEVIAIEVRQYRGANVKTLVPRVVGQTIEAQGKKSGRSRSYRHWDEESLLDEIKNRFGEDQYRAARRIIDWSRKKIPRFTWGKGLKDGAFIPVLDHVDRSYWPFALYTYGRVEMQFQYLKNSIPFDDVQKREEFRRRLNSIAGVDIPEKSIDKRPSIPLSVFTDSKKLDKFLRIINWVINQIKAT